MSMPKTFDFQELWNRHPKSRELGRDVNPDGNRCALVLGATLRNAYKPRLDRSELSFRQIKQPPDGIRGQPFLDKYYVRAQDFANRLREEWGPPDLVVVGPSALEKIKGRRGTIFVQDAWRTGMGRKTVDHVDLWNGEKMGGYSADASRAVFQQAKFVQFWEEPRR